MSARRVELEADAQARCRSGQAPCGELNEKRARLQLVDGGAVEGAAVALAEALLLEGAGVRRRHEHDALARGAAPSRPSRRAGRRPGRGAPASKGARRRPRGGRRAGRRRPRWCGACTCPAWARRRGPCSSPSTRTRTKPCAARASKTRSPSVLRSLTSGPSTRSAAAVRQGQDAVHDLLHASCARSRGRSWGSAGGRRARTAGAGGRRSR